MDPPKRSKTEWLKSKLKRLSKKESQVPGNDLPPSYEAATQNETPKPGGVVSGSSSRVPDRKDSTARSGPSKEDTNQPTGHGRKKHDPFGILSHFDTVLLIDDSASMAGQDGTDLSRWEQTGKVLEYVVPVVTKYDDDGVDVYFLNNVGSNRSNVRTSEEVMDLFNEIAPCHGTPIGTRLQEVFKNYLSEYETYLDQMNSRKLKKEQFKRFKPMNVICITDGAPWPYETQARILIGTIVHTAKEIERLNKKWESICGKRTAFTEDFNKETKIPKGLRQLGVQFVQVGNDRGATAFLKKLDEDLAKGAVPDIVDTFNHHKMLVELTEQTDESEHLCLKGEDLLKVVLGAIDKSMDKQLEED